MFLVWEYKNCLKPKALDTINASSSPNIYVASILGIFSMNFLSHLNLLERETYLVEKEELSKVEKEELVY